MCLHQEEVHDRRSGETATCENVSVAKVDGRRDEGGEESGEKIPEPVRGRRDGHALGPVAGRIELGDDNPHHWSPGAGERGDEQTCECDHGDTGLRGAFRSVPVQGEVADRCKHHEADEHPQSPCDQTFSTAESFDEVEAWEGHDDVDGAEDDLSHVAVVEARGPEDTGHGQQPFRAGYEQATSYLVP